MRSNQDKALEVWLDSDLAPACLVGTLAHDRGQLRHIPGLLTRPVGSNAAETPRSAASQRRETDPAHAVRLGLSHWSAGLHQLSRAGTVPALQRRRRPCGSGPGATVPQGFLQRGRRKQGRPPAQSRIRARYERLAACPSVRRQSEYRA